MTHQVSLSARRTGRNVRTRKVYPSILRVDDAGILPLPWTPVVLTRSQAGVAYGGI